MESEVERGASKRLLSWSISAVVALAILLYLVFGGPQALGLRLYIVFWVMVIAAIPLGIIYGTQEKFWT
jgi:hypothetical protein